MFNLLKIAEEVQNTYIFQIKKNNLLPKIIAYFYLIL